MLKNQGLRWAEKILQFNKSGKINKRDGLNIKGPKNATEGKIIDTKK